ncbi:hypothetical protein IWQ56_007310, partial [Coemansia nantahalensis]
DRRQHWQARLGGTRGQVAGAVGRGNGAGCADTGRLAAHGRGGRPAALHPGTAPAQRRRRTADHRRRSRRRTGKDGGDPLPVVRARRRARGRSPRGAPTRRGAVGPWRQSAAPRAWMAELQVPGVRWRGHARHRHAGQVCRRVVVLFALHRCTQRAAPVWPSAGVGSNAGRSL